MEFSKEQQEHINKLVGEARVKAREVAKTQFEADQAKAKDVAEAAALAANQEWQKLAATHEARVTELEPLQAQVETYQKMVGKMLRERIKELGESAKKAVDGLPEGMAALEKLNWLTKNEGLFVGQGDGVGTPRGKKKTPQVKEVKIPKSIVSF